jgi:hypothetical protein
MTDVIVTQADRDAALFAAAWTSSEVVELNSGAYDHYRKVQAFARHRIAALEALLPPTAEMVEAMRGSSSRVVYGDDSTATLDGMFTAAIRTALGDRK